MTSRRDWLLQQLGITQWTLRRPTALQGEIAVRLPAATRLLIVADPLPDQNDPLLWDVIRSLRLSPDEICRLTPQQLDMLPEPAPCPCWWLGCEPPQPQDGVRLTSPALPNLYQSPGAKRALWQQICQHELHFHPDLGRPDGGL